MRISTSTGTCGSVFWTQKMYYSCEQAIESIAKAGFDAIDLCLDVYKRQLIRRLHVSSHAGISRAV